MSTNPLSNARLAELVLHIAGRSAGDPRFGKTKLNKILFFADFAAYEEYGESITRATYQRLPNGPAPHQVVPVLRQLENQGAISVVHEDTYAGKQQRVVALRRADLEGFSDDQVAMVDRVVGMLAPLNNSQVSDLSHKTKAWRLTDDYQEIHYGTAMLALVEPNEADIAWLEEIGISVELVADS